MGIQRIRPFMPFILLICFFWGLSSCGLTPAGMPDSVQITLPATQLGSPVPPAVTSHNLNQVHQLYQDILAMHNMPIHALCPLELGPHYPLVFSQGSHVVMQALAMYDGCWRVQITGESAERQVGNQSFWTLLDQTIIAALPVPNPTSLAIIRAQSGLQPLQTASISDPATTRRVFQAIQALPQTVSSECQIEESPPAYQLVFHISSPTILATISQTCQKVVLKSNEPYLGGTFTLTPAFQHLWSQTLAGVAFAPAQPDALAISVSPPHGPWVNSQVTDMALIQKLYTNLFTLTSTPLLANCPGEDKVSGTATVYGLSFILWTVPVMNLVVSDGKYCKYIHPSYGLGRYQNLIGTNTFWNLLHQVAKD